MAQRTAGIVAVALCAAAVLTPWTAAASGSDDDPNAMQLNVRNMAVSEVIKLIAEEGEFSVAIGDGVKGNVTLYVDEVTPRELLDVVVGVIDAAYVEENGTIWVMNKARYESRYGQPFVDNRRSKTFVLKDAQVNDVVKSVRDLLGDKAIVRPDPNQNSLRVTAPPRLLYEARKLLEDLDKPLQTRTFTLTSMPVATASLVLGKIVSDEAIVVEDPANSRLIISGTAFELNRVAETLAMMDTGEGLESHVLPVAYAEPDSLAERLRPHLTPEIGTIYPDKQARKIVIVDYPAVVDHVVALAGEFDMPFRQVLIEAKILQVSMSNEMRSGIDWAVLQNEVNLTGSFSALSNGFQGDFGDISSKDYQVIVDALESYGETNLLSSPRLVVVDGMHGMIHVGSQVPYKTVTTRESATGTLNLFEEVVVIEVGVKLEVQVRIHGDDMISLIVHPEVSSVTSYQDGIPVVEASTADSALMVRDGNTVILGGLIKDETRTTREGVPLLCRIPLVKYLFSSNVTEEYKSELVILMTPRILDGTEDFTREGLPE